MKISAAEIADAPPHDSILTRATGRRLAGASASGDRTIDFVASDPSVGRDGHRILANAWQTENFLRNPVFLFSHLDHEPPIGKIISLLNVGVELRALVRFAEPEVYDFAETVYQLYRGSYLNACSTGWLPLEWKAANDRARPGGLDFTSVDLLEISAVSVPALPTALATARSAGINLKSLGAWTERALDSHQRLYSEKELTMIRTAAGAAPLYSAARRPLVERSAERERVARIGADPASGFRSFGDFLQAVARAGSIAPAHDRRLVRAPTGLSEGDVSAGGFLVPETYIEAMVASTYDEATIAPLCKKFETDLPGMASMPGIDETSRADGSRWGGVTAYWDSEATSVPTSMPKWRSVVFGASKLFGVCVATNELLADAPMLGSYLLSAFGAELGFKVDAAILNGTGAGVPLGITNAPALITVAKSIGQPAATIIPENIESMWARLPASSRRRAVWLMNEDAEGQLSAVGATGTTPTNTALYIPTGAAGNPYPLLKGRPAIVVEQAKPLGTPGDIVLANLTAYAIVASALKMNMSMDVNFLTDQCTFRFVWRLDGRPLWKSPVTPYNGSGLTRSPFVALAQR